MSKMSQGSPNGAAAVADPYPIYTSTATVHGFDVDRKDGSRTNRLYSDRVDKNASLEDFVDGASHSGTVSTGTDHGMHDRSHHNRGNEASITNCLSERKSVVSSRSKQSDDAEKHHSNGNQNSPNEGSYLQGYGSFDESAPTASTSRSEKEQESESTTVATAISPVTEDTLDPWIGDGVKPLNPFEDPDFQRFGEPNRSLGLKRRSQLSEGGDSSDGFTGATRYSSEDERSLNGFGKARSNGNKGGEDVADPGHDEWLNHQNGQSLYQNFLDYEYPGIFADV